MTGWAIAKSRITLTAMAIIVVGGFASYSRLPQDEDPGFTIRTAAVVTYFPGASPERMENLVTDPIEAAIQEIPELDYSTSESRTGVSVIKVNIRQQYTAMRPIWDSLRRKIDRIRADLPDGVVGPLVNDEYGDVFGILLTLTGEGYSYAELKTIADQVRDELLRIAEVAKVEIYGAQEERVFVEYNNARLAELDLSVYQLQQILESANVIVPGGSVRIGSERIVLEPSGNFESLDDLRRTAIRLPGRRDVLFLDDVADVYRGYIDPPRTMLRSSGVPALGLGVSLRKGGNVLVMGEEVGRTIAALQARYPIGVEFDLIADQPGRVETKVDEFAGNLLQAIGIVLLVMLLTLGLRTGLVVASLIPAAMLMTLLVMDLAGIGLDQMSLASLIIALGMLIDNAIVMSESIMVQMAAGKPAVTAAIASGRELRVPLLTSSLTTSAAFLPIYLAESTAGEYTGVIFTVVTIALLSSWVLSLTMTPLLCATFLRPGGAPAKGDEFGSWFYVRYRSALMFLLRRRALVAIAAVVLLAVTVAGFRFVPVIFFPPSDRSFFTAQLDLPTGTDIEATEEVTSRIEQFVQENLTAGPDRPEGVTGWATFVGGGEPRYILTYTPEEPRPSYAFMLINTTAFEMVQPSIERLRTFCEETFPDLIPALAPSALGPPVEQPIQVRISGGDPARLFTIADRLAERLRSMPGTLNIQDDWGRRTKKLIVRVNQPRARRAGVSNLDVAVSLQSILSGIESTEFREENELVPIILRSVEADRHDLAKLETLDVYSQATGRSVPLKQVADIEVAWEASKIYRRNRSRTLTVSCDLVEGLTANEVNARLLPWLEEESRGWPIGYTYELGGEIESSGEANASIMEQLPIAALVIILLLVGQFNSIRRPAIVLATMPLGLMGVVIGLIVARSYFGFMTLLGIVSLAGIVINNAIVLLDRIRIEIEENGRTPQRAILEAAQRRLRPILLTTATTIGGMLPLWFGGGPMWEPMAIAIIFGLGFATVLTLGLVPVLYALFFKVDFRTFHYES